MKAPEQRVVIYDTKVNVQSAINLFLSYLERSACAKMSPATLFYSTIIKMRKQKLLLRRSSCLSNKRLLAY